MPEQTRLIQGNQAIAEGAFYAGAKFFAGYPITPSSEVAEESARQLPKIGGVFMQMEDEIASMGAIVGASLAGAKSFTATSGPGFSLMQENLGMAIAAEVPCVIVNVMRSGPSTGLATKPGQADVMQIRWGRHGDQTLIALSPASVKECFELTVKAFNFAEKYRVPVVLAADEIVAHMRENYSIPAPGELEVIDRKKPTMAPELYKPYTPDEDGIAPLAVYGSEYVYHVTSSMHGPEGSSNNNPANAAWKVGQLHEKIERYRDEIVMTKEFAVEDMDILVVTFGATTRAAREAIAAARSQGIKAGVLQLVTVWPLPDLEVARLGQLVKRVVVPEMNYSGQIAAEVQRILGPSVDIRRVNKYNGTIITPQDILNAIK
ncbi:MAG: 2-oxoacid:acceptor oxidoreductase subunit alpha [Syntrophomonadaceae bacterium]|nr:2-oxoacid:acceptor oxidoreductase subunit alpha [Syntrophomonadaceae bacterium]